MRILFLGVVFLCLAAGACARHSRPASVSGSSNGKVSFGVYDMSSSNPYSVVTEALMSETNVAESANLADQTRSPASTSANSNSAAVSLPHSSVVPVNPAPSDRKIIRNAELNLEADDPEDAQRSITSIAESKGGFVVESQQSSSDIQSATRDIVLMSVRIPSEKFSETLDEIRKTASRVVIETVKGEDVTEEFVDIEAQLKAKKALEEQFMSIMKRANTVDDALSVQSQLAEVRSQIERIEGRKRFLENQSSLSTIKIRLQTAKVFAASSVGFGDRLTDAFLSGFDVAMNFILGFVTFVIAVLPFAVLIGLPLFAIIRYVVRRQSGPKSITQIAEEEITTA